MFVGSAYAQPVEVPPAEMYGLEPTSGFVDENNRPISEEEYRKIADEQSKGLFEKYPMLAVGAIALVIGGIMLFFISRKGKR